MQVESGGWGVSDWSPDDKKLLVGEFISANESYGYVVDVATGEKTLLTPKGGEKVAYGGAQFAKDGKGVYVTTDKESEFQRLAYIDLATKQHTYLTDHIKWDVDEFDVSPDGSTDRLRHERGRHQPPAPARHEDAQGEDAAAASRRPRRRRSNGTTTGATSASPSLRRARPRTCTRST